MAPHAAPDRAALSRDDRALAGLRALADLVNEALARLGTGRSGTAWLRPVLAGPTLVGPTLVGPMLAEQSAVDSVPVARRPSPSRPRPRPATEPPTPATEPQTPTDDAHAETWQLVTRAQQGDGEAFGQLYDRYVDTVFRFIYYRVNDRALAEDFTSETFLRALRRIGTISYQGRDIGAWFVTIARNIVLDHLKSARHRLETPTAETVEGNDFAQSTESAVLDSLRAERLMAAVARLGDEQRECVLLRFVQGLSVSETAAAMGKNEGAVKALQHRAVRKLAEMVGGELR